MKTKTVFWFIWTIFVATNIALLLFFALKTGIKAYWITSSIVTLGAGGFIFLVLKHGFMISRGRHIRRDESAAQFNGNVVFLFIIYLIGLFMVTCFYLQEIGYLPRTVTH